MIFRPEKFFAKNCLEMLRDRVFIDKAAATSTVVAPVARFATSACAAGAPRAGTCGPSPGDRNACAAPSPHARNTSRARH